METILEVVRIEQIIREAVEGVDSIIRIPEDGAQIASRFISRDNREVFFVMCLNTKNNVLERKRLYLKGGNNSLFSSRYIYISVLLNVGFDSMIRRVHVSYKVWNHYILRFLQ